MKSLPGTVYVQLGIVVLLVVHAMRVNLGMQQSNLVTWRDVVEEEIFNV